jgi:hypothetical protein
VFWVSLNWSLDFKIMYKLIPLLFLLSCSSSNENEYLLLKSQLNPSEEYGYITQNGETVIPFGKYSICFTDTFRNHAIVLIDSIGFVSIDRNENIQYKIFTIDNGPDSISDGLFRIIIDDKIGYANSLGEIKIKPQYKFAFPFINGKAKVTNEGYIKQLLNSEYHSWESNNWFYIDKHGKQI